MTNDEIASFFNTAQAHIQGNPNLRDPQVDGWYHTRQHFRNSREHAILQIPVGCGKTGLTVPGRQVLNNQGEHGKRQLLNGVRGPHPVKGSRGAQRAHAGAGNIAFTYDVTTSREWPNETFAVGDPEPCGN
ncbi:hypothetical protein GD604_14820 [Desulfolutivibrio sulfoxidireducens]|nr:hypothetical protein GD604_14820 [Desulfolutivibrio sulfoxidireducens]